LYHLQKPQLGIFATHTGTDRSRFCIFQHVTNCHDSEVRKILNSSSTQVKLCHPLCSCDQCEKVLDRHRNDPEAVTVFSRDDLGRTALHIASDYGNYVY
jgi:ankyrin repeat protein